MVQALYANAVCGSVISLTLHTGDPGVETVLVCASPRMAKRDGRVPKPPPPPGFILCFFSLLSVCPGAVLEIESERKNKEARKRRGEGKEEGWWICLCFHALGKQI
ncbi:hypothetical protein NL108_018694 [Boleophthalmus pectinirostris]|nr:hypothetical protein NL108_018694 [Boleophthalmus pectinirostris]